jgi:phosphate transport system substrate-binding protein
LQGYQPPGSVNGPSNANTHKEKLDMELRGSKHFAVVGGAVAVALLAAACSSSSSSSSSAPAAGGSSSSGAALSGTLNGSGSSFQKPFQEQAIQNFKSVQSGMTVNYGGGGSGKGRTDLASGVVNFAGSDSPVPDKEKSNFTGKTVLYFPVVIGPITLSYNLSGVSGLKLDATTIANIFQAKIKTWNDPAITALNPGVSLPSSSITLAVRSDSSGTTQNFSLFLDTAVPNVWTLGSSSTISWPSTARAGNGNSGVAQIVKSTPGAIGYVDYADAKASGLTYASIKNKDGNFIAPSPESASAAVAGTTVKPDLTFHAVWATGAQAYPITYQSWDLVIQAQSSANTTKMLQAYIGYLLGPMQQQLSTLGYAALPVSLDAQAKAQLDKIGTP